MTIIELGALGEFFGSIAVVATLIYLVIHLRQNTDALRTTVEESISRSSQEMIMAAPNDELLARR